MTRILFDTNVLNVLLDALLAREPFVADAAFLLESVEAGEIEGFMSATTITDVYYLVRRQTGSAETATKSVIQLLALMEICGVDRRVVEQAIALGFDDFEDAIQVACAIALGLEAIRVRSPECP